MLQGLGTGESKGVLVVRSWEVASACIQKCVSALLCSEWITSTCEHSTGNPPQRHVPAWLGWGLGGGWLYVCVAETLCCSPGTTTALFTGYTATQNKQFEVWEGKDSACLWEMEKRVKSKCGAWLGRIDTKEENVFLTNWPSLVERVIYTFKKNSW